MVLALTCCGLARVGVRPPPSKRPSAMAVCALADGFDDQVRQHIRLSGDDYRKVEKACSE
jgi:hypothetical protein